jgi:hypothetical protein
VSATNLKKCRFNAVSSGLGSFVVATPAAKLKYDFDTNSLLGWTGQTATVTATSSGMTFVPTGTDPMLRSPTGLSINGAIQRYVAIDIERIALRTLGGWDGHIYYQTAGHAETGSFYNTFPEITNVVGTRVTIILDMHTLSVGGTDWAISTIMQFRIDFEDGQTDGVTPDGQFKIHSIIVGDAIGIRDYATPAVAGAVNLDYDYIATNGITEWEMGNGAYTVGSTTLARTFIASSSNNGAKVNFTSPPVVTMTNATTQPPITSDLLPIGTILQVLQNLYTSGAGITALIPYDNTTPLNSEGTQINSQAITLLDNTNKVLVSFQGSGSWSAGDVGNGLGIAVIVAVFRGSTCIAARSLELGAAWCFSIEHLDSPAATSATYTVRIGGDDLVSQSARTVWPNTSTGGAAKLNGTQACVLTLKEVAA